MEGGCSRDGALLLRVIANAAARFPPKQAHELAKDLQRVWSHRPAFTICLDVAATQNTAGSVETRLKLLVT